MISRAAATAFVIPTVLGVLLATVSSIMLFRKAQRPFAFGGQLLSTMGSARESPLLGNFQRVYPLHTEREVNHQPSMFVKISQDSAKIQRKAGNDIYFINEQFQHENDS
mmetsp:Transcript_16663/g.20027  ORF Transcript_16663/g.20027 Transcript_16663/m.20027 type:complete len:109 (+) Transcript_16663:92-418(+)|eukprot:jgi/Bigna1/59097/fgenesh1_kg.2_\